MQYIQYFIDNIQLLMSLVFKTVGLTIVSFVMIIIIDISYIKKILAGKVKVSSEFSYLMFLPIFPLGFEMLRTFLMGMDINNKMNTAILIMDKIIIITSLMWVMMFIYYLIHIYIYKIKQKDISKKENKNKLIINGTITLISILLSFIIPFEKNVTLAGTIYLSGPILNVIKILFTLSMIICTILFIKHKKKLTNVYITPLLFIDSVYILLIILEKFACFYTTYITSFFVFIVMLLFFTLESQDKKILDDYNIAVEKEKKLKKGKENFLTHAFHDIISPSYVIQGYSGLCIEDNLLDEEKINYIESESIKLKNVAENLVTISHLQKGKIIVEQSNYSTDVLYNKIKQDIEDFNKNELIKFTLEKTGEFSSELYGDYKKIHTIITKIIFNSITNTNYGEIKLNISEEKLDKNYTSITFDITNNSHHMTEEAYNMSFEDYIIENNSIHSDRIGFLIAKSFIDMLGGEIKFSSSEEEGTKYNIKITQKRI